MKHYVVGMALIAFGFSISGHLLAADQIATAIGNCNVVVNASGQSRVEVTSNCNKETAADLQKQLNKERTERTALGESVAPRTLSVSQRKSLVASLSSIKSLRLRVIRLGDAEAGAFADSWIETLRQAGAEVEVRRVGMMGSNAPTNGLFLTLNPDSPISLGISEALRKAGVTFSFRKSSVDQVDAELLVGYRPLGPSR